MQSRFFDERVGRAPGGLRGPAIMSIRGSKDRVDWIDGPTCAACQKKFTVLLAKHHCHACLQSFCANCSGHTHAVPPRWGRFAARFWLRRPQCAVCRWLAPVRVCDRCFRGFSADEVTSVVADSPAVSENNQRVNAVYPHVFVVTQLYRPTDCQHCKR